MHSPKYLQVIALLFIVSQPAFAQYKIGDRLVVISQAEIGTVGGVWQMLGRGQDVRVDGVNVDQVLVKNLAAGWISQDLVRSPAAAIGVFSNQIKLNPLDAGAYYARAITFTDLDHYDLAISDFTRAIQLAPKHACAFNGRGNCWANIGETSKAIANYTEAIRLDPNAAITFANRARMWNVTGDFVKAIDDANEAVRLAPTYANGHSARAVALAATKRFDEAIADCDRISIISAAGVSGYNDVAWFLATSPDAGIRDGKKAVEFAGKAFDLTKGLDGGVLDTLAIAWAELADFDQAVACEQKAIAISSDRDRPDFESHLKLFQSGRTLRDTPSDNDPSPVPATSSKTGTRRPSPVTRQRQILAAKIRPWKIQ